MKRIVNIFNFLSSVTFTIIIIAGMILLPVMKSLVEINFKTIQDQAPSISKLIDILYDFFQLDVLIQSWCFKTLLILFTINLITCTLKRIPQTLKSLDNPAHMVLENPNPSLWSLHERLAINDLSINFENKLHKLLSNNYTKTISTKKKGDTHLFFSYKGKYSFMGFYLAHCGLLIVIIGALIGAKGSVQGTMFLEEGKESNMIWITGKRGLAYRNLDYSVNLDRKELIKSSMGHNNRNKNPYRSIITLIKDAQKIKTVVLDGYETLKYKKVRIAQPPYSSEVVQQSISLAILPKIEGAVGRIYTVNKFASFIVPETGHLFRIASIYFYHNEPNMHAPTDRVYFEVYGEDKRLLYSFNYYSNKEYIDSNEPWKKDYEISLLAIEETEPKMYATYKINLEPESDAVWVGAYMSIAGFIIMFFCSHRKIWVKVEQKNNTHKITMAGWDSRRQEAVKDTFTDIKKLASKNNI